MCNKCRAVTLLCITFKILANMLYVKLVPYAEEIIEYQGVFQWGRSTLDQIFTMREILKTDGNKNEGVHHLPNFKQHMTMNGGRKYGAKCLN